MTLTFKINFSNWSEKEKASNMMSVLIRADKDERVFDCISSIRKTSPNSDIKVSILHNKSLEERIAKLGIKYCVVPKGNISITTNRGLKLIKNDKVLITDSDTIFDKNCIKLINKALNKYQVVKPLIIFKNDGSTRSILVANLRTYFNSKNNKMFTPGLAFRMHIKNKVGGYYFDNKVAWGEDSEFSNRVEYAKLRTFVIKNARLFHPPVTIRHDLGGAFLIGAKKPENKSFIEIIIKRFKTYYEILSDFGCPTFLYGFVWYFFFDFGKITKHTGKTGKKMQNYFWKL
ncbi:MAG TPA: glycosyltransferase [Patescibacteria group bacterium]|nr:glycosyltransferase [Patescibacteria group bacterium]